MKILLACDKFKGSLSATKVCNAIGQGIISNAPDATLIQQPLADGGDGTLKIMESQIGFEKISVKTIDPLNRKVEATYLSNQKTAFIELAEASGITLLHSTELDVLKTNTVGTGLLIHHAIKAGHQEIILALGGSCTNDVGLGIAYALGFVFLDESNTSMIPTGGNLKSITKIIPPTAIPTYKLTILSDVTNPLYGTSGAAHVYAPQKGANQDEIILLDYGMKHIANLINQTFGKEIDELEGGGAAGGIAAGLYGLLKNVEIKNGFDFIAEKVSLYEVIQQVDYVITGEGKFDKTSLNGKVVGKLLELCEKFEKPLIVVSGNQVISDNQIKSLNIYATDSILNYATDVKDAMMDAEKYLMEIGSNLRFK